MGALRVRGVEPARDDPRAAAGARGRRARARQPERGLPVHARVGARDDPRRPRDAGHDRRRASRGSARRARCSRPPSSRASWTTSSPRWPTSPSSRTARSTSCRCSTTSTAASYEVVLPTAGAAHRRRRALHRAAQLRGVLPGAWSRSPASPRTSTATALRAHPGRRAVRGPDPAAARADRAAAREREPAAARHPPGEDAQAALQAEREVPHPAGAGPERRRGSGAAHDAPDQEAGAGVRGDPVPVRARPRDRRVHPVEPALLPAGLGARARHRVLHGGGRAADRPGRGSRPGPDGERRRRQDRRGRLGAARGRQGRGRDEDQGRVQADLPRLDGAAAAEDRPQGHVPGARPRQQAGGRAPRGRARAGGEHAPGREQRRVPRAARRGHARLPPDPAERGRHGLRRRGHGRRPSATSRPPPRTCARSSSASSRRRATARRSPRAS